MIKYVMIALSLFVPTIVLGKPSFDLLKADFNDPIKKLYYERALEIFHKKSQPIIEALILEKDEPEHDLFLEKTDSNTYRLVYTKISYPSLTDLLARKIAEYTKGKAESKVTKEIQRKALSEVKYQTISNSNEIPASFASDLINLWNNSISQAKTNLPKDYDDGVIYFIQWDSGKIQKMAAMMAAGMREGWTGQPRFINQLGSVGWDSDATEQAKSLSEAEAAYDKLMKEPVHK